MSWFKRKPKPEPDVYFFFGSSRVKEGIYLQDVDKYTALVRLTKSSYPWTRGEIMKVQKCKMMRIQKNDHKG